MLSPRDAVSYVGAQHAVVGRIIFVQETTTLLYSVTTLAITIGTSGSCSVEGWLRH